MVNNQEKIKALEEEIGKTQYNKATQHHIGLLKAKIARLNDRIEFQKSQKTSGKGFFVRKAGDATVVMLGFPSVGKSTILNKLTNADSKVGAYDFTTLECIPGMLLYKQAKIQLLDVPGVIKGAADGTGRGKESLTVMRTADLILLVADAASPQQLDVLSKELQQAGFRMNQRKPDVQIKKIERGGIDIGSSVKLTKIDERTIKEILMEYRINNCHVLIREDITPDQLIDVLAGNRCYIPGLVVFNKIDAVGREQLSHLKGKGVCISAEQGINLGELREAIYRKLDFIRIYLKEAGKKADLSEPMIIQHGATVKTVCQRLHRDFVAKFRFARIWGKSAKFPGQKMGIDHVLKDEDVLQVYLR